MTEKMKCNSVLNEKAFLLSNMKQPLKSRCSSKIKDSKDSNSNNKNQDYAPEWISRYPKKLQPRLQPGVYMILCLVNDYRYYGETGNISKRLAGHRRDLRRKIHQSRMLQEDFNLFAEENFEFSVLFIGDDWKDRNKRLEKESQLILDHPNQCYNTYASMADRTGEKNSFFKKKHEEKTKKLIGDLQRGIAKDMLGTPISIEGKVFPSLAEASRQLNHARKTIRHHIDSSDPRYANWFRLSENA